MKTVTIYSTPSCGYCKMAKEYFTENDVAFEDYDVAADVEKRNEMIEKTGQMGVPVIMIAEEGADPEVVIGFDKPRLAELLGLS
jgi:glutaredoxin 3